MATKSAIGKMAVDARNRLTAAMTALSQSVGVPPVDLETIRYRDPAYEAAAHLAALADWAEQIAAQVPAGDKPARPVRKAKTESDD